MSPTCGGSVRDDQPTTGLHPWLLHSALCEGSGNDWPNSREMRRSAQSATAKPAESGELRQPTCIRKQRDTSHTPLDGLRRSFAALDHSCESAVNPDCTASQPVVPESGPGPRAPCCPQAGSSQSYSAASRACSLRASVANSKDAESLSAASTSRLASALRPSCASTAARV